MSYVRKLLSTNTNTTEEEDEPMKRVGRGDTATLVSFALHFLLLPSFFIYHAKFMH